METSFSRSCGRKRDRDLPRQVLASSGRSDPEAAAWWLANRPAAPDAFVVELARAVELIASMPHAGQPYAHPEEIGVWRVLLRRVRYHIYYLPADEERTIEVLSLWHVLRGTDPPL